ncbi:PQQ-binding-like beta-propeller repeat protein [Pseudohongiella sp.]|uniref:Cytochrome c domain-containing protein n=1 Tax=marine sediment metagenome TaxID=412755 RepID=A0A0F9YQG1_9ZZZZ|nr:PQQ-binding-like beta-propeller repeat protein [Pseudohongiella sp.]HDZ10152.1 pyrroloquinoline quinone-dependent dehydrogenase [Pseudohongiella sp.]HEA64317.1 pyrroloquinoline quinone-dependent dehydrogenase [Pseudohongiella sp.]
MNLFVRKIIRVSLMPWVLISVPALSQYGAPDGEWHTWGGDHGFTRYSALEQINTTNAADLQVAWRWRALPLGDRPDRNLKATPLMIDGVLYMPSGAHQVVALDAATGQEIWRYTPTPASVADRGLGLGSRSLAYWRGDDEARIFHNTLDGRLLAIDAHTGLADPAFGDKGTVMLREGLYPDGSDAESVGSSSPPAVVGDVVVAQVVGSITAANREATPGHIRGYDVRTGELVWRFNTIAQPGEPGHESWQGESWRYTGNTGVWSMMSVDTDTGYIYLPVEAGSNDFYGGQRHGDNLFSQSLVCLDGRTGELIWHYQLTHHGLWDYDPPSAPILGDIVVDGKRVKTVTQLTKQGMSFVFDRLTGEPVWPIEERAVPPSEVPGERASPTQPFPTLPEPYLRQGYHEDELIEFTPALRREALEIASRYVRGPIYTPPTPLREGGTQGTWVNPGYQGGSNWNGAAFDPGTGTMFVPLRKAPMAAALLTPDPSLTNWQYLRAPSVFIQGPRGLPVMRPPWSLITATDMNRGRHTWSRSIGPASDYIRQHPDLQGLDLDFDNMGHPMIRPSPLVTSTLLFLAEAGHLSGDPGGPMFRAYDKVTGAVVAEIELPAKASGAPMTYFHQGYQYIVIAVATADHPAELVALALPGAVTEYAGDIAATTGTPSPAPEITLSDEESVAAAQQFARLCATCHGDRGQGVSGGSAPALVNLSDPGPVNNIIARGGVEMPAFALQLDAVDIEVLSRYVSMLSVSGSVR